MRTNRTNFKKNKQIHARVRQIEKLAPVQQSHKGNRVVLFCLGFGSKKRPVVLQIGELRVLGALFRCSKAPNEAHRSCGNSGFGDMSAIKASGLNVDLTCLHARSPVWRAFCTPVSPPTARIKQSHRPIGLFVKATGHLKGVAKHRG
ncbi:hypothetical protein TWF594_002358 [Orbilia oligospora]|nr:hypothetical protein TWF706_000908 [Orbilia oligospora]KAF3147780.1 hypothetical protein TWF594_002358 [Orbilia oligospora]